MFKGLLTVLLVLCLVGPALAQSGKITGVVTDKDTGEPLPGVNVVVDQTLLGSATDVDGFFVILNVPPGAYTVVFDYIGYQAVEVSQVRVVSDLTKRLDVEMTSTTIELDEAVVVVAEKPFFEVAATNTVRVLDSEEIERIPVKGVNSIIAVNAGVVVQDGSGGETDNATINVRGGRGNETLFIVDGIPYNDALFGNMTGTIPDAAIEQVSSQLGGFSAKYGSAQSGVVNIVTKSGGTQYFGSLEGVTSQGFDDFGYNSVNATLGGPLTPGESPLTFFMSGEFIKTDDDQPRAVGLEIPATTAVNPASGEFVESYDEVNQANLSNNESQVMRFTGKLDATFFQQSSRPLRVTLSGNGSLREARDYIHSYAKTNSAHNPRHEDDTFGGSLKLSHVINPKTFWDGVIRYKQLDHVEGDGLWFDDLEAYGDTLANQIANPHIDYFGWGDDGNDRQGTRVVQDENGVFFGEGRVSNFFRKYNIKTIGADFNFTTQIEDHFLEFGATFEQNEVRLFSISPLGLAQDIRGADALPAIDRYVRADPFYYGYDVQGNEISSDQVMTTADGDEVHEFGAPKPVTAAVYLQDKVEFQDFILNFGVRWDYFNPNYVRLADIYDVFGAGPNAAGLDIEDFEDMPTETYVSPRFGFAFPVTERTVFHAQYGIFRQAPRLLDLYSSWGSIDNLERDDNRQVDNGHLKSESTTQYEFGFKHQFGNVASLDITAYYKNIEGLTNVVREQFLRGQSEKPYLTTANTDFGTIKGLAFNFNLRRIGPVTTKFDYTLALSEGTGSSQSSSFTAAFRNQNGETPIAIAPLDFDQRHTLSVNVDIRNGKDEGPSLGNIRPLADAGANFLISFNSGRPYTPLALESVLPGATSNQGEVTQYINSVYSEPHFRVDLRLDKEFDFSNISLTPYVWIQNLLDRANVIAVYQSTGEADDTQFLASEEGLAFLQARGENRASSESDYLALERDPEHYGIPRLIRAGVKIKF